jgi:N-acetylglucosaminyldiphosphoundecaprenol N-acetyl-beta-D-mannosaminyltransferase
VKQRFLGCRLDAISREEILSRCNEAMERRSRLRIEGVNVAKLIDARRSPALREALDEAEIVHVDGTGLAWGLALLGHRFPPKRAGFRLMLDLIEEAARRGGRVYLLGATQDVVEETARVLTGRYPGIVIAGKHNGYFAAAEEKVVVQAIRDARAHLLFIGISSPKKELFLRRHWADLGVPVAMGVGGSFDAISNKVRTAPLWLEHLGFAWIFRLLQEPRRLFMRYLLTNAAFLGLLLGEFARSRFTARQTTGAG